MYVCIIEGFKISGIRISKWIKWHGILQRASLQWDRNKVIEL